MRGKILNALLARMTTDERLFFLTGDMGINLVEPIEEAFPKRFLNVGIAEQNLIGVAAGLCNLGFLPVVYTISNFLIHRCLEQIRDDIVLHENKVILLGTSAGFDNAPLGPTHHIVDEWGMLKGLPGIDVYATSSVEFAEKALDLVIAREKSAYIRIAKGTPSIPGADGDFLYLEGGKGAPLLVSYGSLVQECLKAKQSRPDLGVLVMNKIHALDAAKLSPLFAKHDRVLVVEDHFPTTGLYSSVCQLAMEQGLPITVQPVAPEGYSLKVGQSSDFYHKLFSLDAAGILDRLAGSPRKG